MEPRLILKFCYSCYIKRKPSVRLLKRCLYSQFFIFVNSIFICPGILLRFFTSKGTKQAVINKAMLRCNFCRSVLCLSASDPVGFQNNGVNSRLFQIICSQNSCQPASYDQRFRIYISGKRFPVSDFCFRRPDRFHYMPPCFLIACAKILPLCRILRFCKI